MTQIVLTEAHASMLVTTDEPVAICRPDGSLVGWVSSKSKFVIPDKCPFTPEEIAAAEKEAESDGRWRTRQEVLAHCRHQEASR